MAYLFVSAPNFDPDTISFQQDTALTKPVVDNSMPELGMQLRVAAAGHDRPSFAGPIGTCTQSTQPLVSAESKKRQDQNELVPYHAQAGWQRHESMA
jgi:hypothetical protein